MSNSNSHDKSTDPILKSIDDIIKAPKLYPKGYPADKFAAIIAAIAAALSFILSVYLFIGFIANDYHFGAILSALALTALLAIFATIPLVIIALIARRLFLLGADLRLYISSLFLIMPWVVLSALCLLYTPIPIWTSSVGLIISLLLLFWAGFSIILELKFR